MRQATEQLIIDISPLSDRAGPVGAAFMLADALFTAPALSIWLDDGSPREHATQLHAGHSSDLSASLCPTLHRRAVIPS